MRLCSSDSLRAIAQNKLEESEVLRCELMAQCDQIESILADMSAKIKANKNNRHNIDGCLIGQVSDYLDTL
eukprot:CAMPEP_0170458764 /NCGR_PEP_ID=MMETSP0123-20130129/5640_1 /TAXON_ID=182087 /ORGANISM="Favella ehrenbergii, Strain Fehren 1" /LENGTH=70 /DNA_ID=CAMNT_0010723051 /DNA_START=52 /DNA_END=264 /DNA_ORIENTATION=+